MFQELFETLLAQMEVKLPSVSAVELGVLMTSPEVHTTRVDPDAALKTQTSHVWVQVLIGLSARWREEQCH